MKGRSQVREEPAPASGDLGAMGSGEDRKQRRLRPRWHFLPGARRLTQQGLHPEKPTLTFGVWEKNPCFDPLSHARIWLLVYRLILVQLTF